MVKHYFSMNLVKTQYQNAVWPYHFKNISQKDNNNLQRIVNIGSKVTGLKQSTLNALYGKQMLRKATKLINDNKHILHSTYSTSTSDISVRDTSFVMCVC